MRSMKMVATTATMAMALALAGAQQYNVVNLGTLGGFSSYAYSVNDHGEVVGYSYFAGDADRRAFRWTESQGMQQLFGYQSEGEDYARGINNSGVAVGTAANGSSHTGVRWTPGQPTDAVNFPNLFSHATSINDAGNVAGIYYPALTAQGSFVMGNQAWTMPLRPFQEGSMSYGINNQNYIAGYRFDSNGTFHSEAVLWNPFGGVTVLGNLGGSAWASSLNDHNQVTGESDAGASGIEHAFYWSEDVGMLSIHGLNDYQSSTGQSINDSGTIVGIANGDGLDGAGFIWKAETGMQTLTSLLDAESQGWRILDARDINELGQIVGLAEHDRFGRRAVLLNPVPVPEPGTIAAISLGLLALRRRRRKVD